MTLDELEALVRERDALDADWLAPDVLLVIARLRATEAAHAEHVSALGALVERAFEEGAARRHFVCSENETDEFLWAISHAKAALDRLRSEEGAE